MTTIRILTADTLTDFEAWVDEQKFIAFDTETTGLDVWADDFDVTVVAFAGRDGSAWVLDGADEPLVVGALTAVIRTRLYAHNAGYDCLAVLARYGRKIDYVRDTVTLARVAFPEKHRRAGGQGFSLKDLRPQTRVAQERLAAIYAAQVGVAVDELPRDWLATATRVLPFDHPAMLEYVSTDAIECALLVMDAKAQVSMDGWRRAMDECALDAAWRFVSQDHGYLIDRDGLVQTLDEIEQGRAEGIERWGVDLMRSSNETREWLAQRDISITDRDGKPTLSHKRFESAKVPASSADDWAEFVKLRNLSLAAGKAGELLKASAVDGRIYPKIPAMEAVTGRQAISGPALQNLTAEMRSVLLADPGKVLIGCDLDRVEPRVLAAVSGDEKMREAVTGDVYEALAVSVWGDEAKGDKAKRDLCKRCLLGMLYGMGKATLADSMGVDEDEAIRVRDALEEAYPVMAQWRRGIQARTRNGEPLSTAYGRPLPCPYDAPYRAVNYSIQGTAKDVLCQATLRVVELLGADVLYLPIHDELIIQVDDDPNTIEKSMRILGEAMTCELDGVTISGTPILIGHRLQKS